MERSRTTLRASGGKMPSTQGHPFLEDACFFAGNGPEIWTQNCW